MSRYWDLSFECPEEKSGHLFTVCFKNGEPTHVNVDG